MIRITIEGPRRSGKTTVGVALKHLLSAEGYEVTFREEMDGAPMPRTHQEYLKRLRHLGRHAVGFVEGVPVEIVVQNHRTDADPPPRWRDRALNAVERAHQVGSWFQRRMSD